MAPHEADETTGLEAPASVPGPGLRPGDVRAGRYRIVSFIAQGGMGEVYRDEIAALTALALRTALPRGRSAEEWVDNA